MQYLRKLFVDIAGARPLYITCTYISSKLVSTTAVSFRRLTRQELHNAIDDSPCPPCILDAQYGGKVDRPFCECGLGCKWLLHLLVVLATLTILGIVLRIGLITCYCLQRCNLWRED